MVELIGNRIKVHSIMYVDFSIIDERCHINHIKIMDAANYLDISNLHLITICLHTVQ